MVTNSPVSAAFFIVGSGAIIAQFCRKCKGFGKDCRNPAGLAPGGSGCTCGLQCRKGCRCPASLSYPAFALFPRPHPPDPRSQSALPTPGKGEIFVIFARGFAPCNPATAPEGLLADGRLSVAEGLSPGASGALLRFAVPEGAPVPGAVGFFLPSYKSFAPSPRPALAERSSHAGEGGEIFVIFCKGLRPLQPQACTGRFAG